MHQYRTKLKIISDVLYAVLSSSGEGGTSLSALMRRSNLSYRGVEQLLSQLLSAGLLTERKAEKGMRYVVSAKGVEYLAHYNQFRTFAESYGLLM